MKPILIITLISAAILFAAEPPPVPINICVKVEAADVPRLYAAFGSILNLGQDATEADVEWAVTQWMGQQTADYERRQNMATFTPPPFETGGSLQKAMQGTPPPAPTPKPKK